MFENTPYAAESQQLARRKALLDAMTQQAISPQQTQMVSGRVVPYGIGQGLTQLAQALVARKGMEKVGEEEKALAEKAAQGRSEAVQRVMETMRGRPQTGGPLRGATDYQPVSPAVPGDPMKAAVMAATDPHLQGTGAQSVMNAMLQSQMRGQGRGGYFSPVDVVTPEGVRTMTFSHREGTFAEPKLPITPPKYDPDVAEKMKEAEKKGGLKAELQMRPQIEETLAAGKKAREMAGIGGIISSARGILETGKPTASGVGTVVDMAAGLIGVSPPGADEAAQLRAIGGALIMKMPRMEGPQSDRDTMLYREMAGLIGDSKVPITQRLAALDIVSSLWDKYSDQNMGEAPEEQVQPPPTGAPEETPTIPEGVDPNLWKYLTPEEQALWR